MEEEERKGGKEKGGRKQEGRKGNLETSFNF
jgi:hypothetical protein